MEGPVIDVDDVIDTELSKTAKMEIEDGANTTKGHKNGDALFRDGDNDNEACQSGRFSVRRYLFATVCVSFGLIVLIIAISLSATANGKNTGSSSSSETDKSNASGSGAGRSPTDDLESTGRSFICLATKSSCPANATKNDWAQVSQDLVGEAAHDLAGFSLAMSCDGSIMAAGAPNNGNETGHVRVYELHPSTGVWSQIGADITGVNKDDEAGTGVAMSGNGKRVAVGAANNDNESGENAGHVRVFDLKGTAWEQVGQDIAGEGAGDKSGRAISMSLDGSRLVIGGALNNATASGAGHVRVYRLHVADNRWKQMGQDLDGASEGDFFGKSVAISGNGNIVAVGGHKKDGGTLFADAGHVRVYHYKDDVRQWLQLGDEIKGPAAGSWFGFTVSLSADGHVLAVGAPGDSGLLPGYTYIYRLDNGGTWKRMGSPVWGGFSVDLSHSGKRVISSSPQGTHNGAQSGTAMVFEYNGTAWANVGSHLRGAAPGEMSGTAVAISGDGMRVASSAPAAVFFGMVNVGFVRAYDFCVHESS